MRRYDHKRKKKPVYVLILMNVFSFPGPWFFRLPVLFIVFSLGIPLSEVQANENKSWQISSPYVLSSDVVAKDVTCNHSTLTIQAEVTGQIFSVGCLVTIGPNSLLHNGIVFSGGALNVESRAEIFGDITQIGGILQLAPKANLRGIIRRYQRGATPPDLFLDASQRYLTFQRIVPQNMDHLNRAEQELKLQHVVDKGKEPINSYLVPNFMEYIFNPEHYRFAQKWMYEKGGHLIDLQIIEFVSDERAFKFWRHMLSFSNLNMSYSVQNSLGDGGHWFFRFQERSTFLWHRENWFFAVHVIAAEDEDGLYLWTDAEAKRDEFIRLLQKALLNNTNSQDIGDEYIGTDALLGHTTQN
ncbi:hypothetical protein WDW89_11840 [Deltaproteobacteria bacterium TL4]